MRKLAEINLKDIRREMEEFRASCGSVMMATTGPKGLLVSYAPYVNVDGRHFIYISEIADHYHNLRASADLSLQFIEDEEKAINIAARIRSNAIAKARFMERDDIFEGIMNIFEELHGNIYQILRGMEDFHLIELNLGEGSFVKGFGLAFDVETNGEVVHKKGLEGKGHR